MPDSQTPTKSQSARFLFGSAKPGRGFLLLYPDRLTAVSSPVDTLGYVIGPVVFLVISLPLSHRIGWAGIAAGSAIGGGIGTTSTKGARSRRRPKAATG